LRGGHLLDPAKTGGQCDDHQRGTTKDVPSHNHPPFERALIVCAAVCKFFQNAQTIVRATPRIHVNQVSVRRRI
jgi:hypothetical protein